MIENWLWKPDLSKEQKNDLLACRLYNAIYSLDDHPLCSTRIVDLKQDTVFEAIEAISLLDRNKSWIVNIENTKTGLEIIRQISNNKEDLPHISTCFSITSFLEPMNLATAIAGNHLTSKTSYSDGIQVIINSILYGVNYIYFPKYYVNNSIPYIYNFVKQFSCSTKIMVSDSVYFNNMLENIFDYDGVVWNEKDILNYDSN